VLWPEHGRSAFVRPAPDCGGARPLARSGRSPQRAETLPLAVKNRSVTRPDPQRQAIEDAAARLSGVYLKIKVLAQKRRIGFAEAGRAAAAEGLVSLEDWALIREAVEGR